MRNFITTEDWSKNELQSVLQVADRLKQNRTQSLLDGKTVALLFLNPSLRTRASFQIGTQQLGAQAVILEPGNGAWGIEFDQGTVMDGAAEEHISEVAAVLSRYCDMICMRAFPMFQDWNYDRTDPWITALVRHSSVPVINMETIVHPCQELALMQTLKEKIGDPAGKNLTVTWTWHPKPLNTAVANSAIMIATKFGMNVRLLCPNPDYLLDEVFMNAARDNAAASGGSVDVTHSVDTGYAGADVVYAKSWGPLPFYGDAESASTSSEEYKHFIVDEEKMKMTNNAIFSHCLPLRRNVKATDGVMDSENCVAIDEAENRLHVQKAMMLNLLGVDPDEIQS
ncbi:MAG: N-acetylornithine carbamoyltransferase [Woeseiaceae bacterium]